MYFKEKEEGKVLISEYVKELEKVLEDDKHILQDEKDLVIGKYLKSLLGDQEIDKSLINCIILRLLQNTICLFLC